MVVLTPDGVPVSVTSISGSSHILVNNAVEVVTRLHFVLDNAHDLTLVEVGHLETLLNSLQLNIRRPCRNSDLLLVHLHLQFLQRGRLLALLRPALRVVGFLTRDPQHVLRD